MAIARRSRVAPVALGVLVQRGAEEFGILRAELGERAGAQAIDLPALARRYRHLDRRAAIPVEQQTAEGFETRVLREAETEQQVERRRLGRPRALRGAVERFLQIGQRMLVELVLAQFEHRLDARDHAMAARLGEQRGVVALGLIVVGAREIDDLGAAVAGEQFGPGEIVAAS